MKKVKNNNYENFLHPQKYLMNKEFTNEMRSILFNLRCKTLNFKDNFHSKYGDNLQCDLCNLHTDSQEEAIKCLILSQHVHIDSYIKYEHIYGSIQEQKTITILFSKLLEVRETLLEMRGEEPAHPGNINTGPVDTDSDL